MFPPSFTPTFSGHETFVLRTNWLKKGYDIIKQHPDLFSQPDAYVKLGVGKNMSQSIRYWGRVCGMFDKKADGTGHKPTPLGDWLLDSDQGVDPYLVSPASWWLLHWQLAARPEAAITWFYTFNLLRGGEFTISQLGLHLQSLAAEHGWRVPPVCRAARDSDRVCPRWFRWSRRYSWGVGPPWCGSGHQDVRRGPGGRSGHRRCGPACDRCGAVGGASQSAGSCPDVGRHSAGWG
ncbi:MAG: DUF4007 family protein [Chloroflexaceae bacterium]|nr:DUF4007 family protein [Chloroflexaceae bacterium]